MDYVRLVLLAVALLATCVTVQSLGMLCSYAGSRASVGSSSPGARTFASRSSSASSSASSCYIWSRSASGPSSSGATQELPNVDTAPYFSLATYTTIGFGDVVVGPGGGCS